MTFFGEPDWGSAGERLVERNRLGGRTFLMGEYSDYSTGRSLIGPRAEGDSAPLATPEKGESRGGMKA